MPIRRSRTSHRPATGTSTCGTCPTAPGCTPPSASSSTMRRRERSAATSAAGSSARSGRTCGPTDGPPRPTDWRWGCPATGRWPHGRCRPRSAPDSPAGTPRTPSCKPTSAPARRWLAAASWRSGRARPDLTTRPRRDVSAQTPCSGVARPSEGGGKRHWRVVADQGSGSLGAYLRDAYAAGTSLADLARATGLGRQRLREAMDEAGIPIRRSGDTTPVGRRARAGAADARAADRLGVPDLCAWLAAQRAAGATLTALAQAVGHSTHWVRWRLERADDQTG